MVQFGEFLKTLSLRPNRVTRDVNFIWTKIDEKCQSKKTPYFCLRSNSVTRQVNFICTKIDEKCQNWKCDIFARAEQNKDPGENCDIFFRDSIRHFSWVLSDLYLLAELIYDAAAAASEHQAMNCHFQSLFSGQSCLMECHDRSGAEATFPPQDPRATPN